MIDLKIGGLTDAQSLMMAGWPTKVVSLVCPGVMSSEGPHHLVVEMDDIEMELQGCILPERHHIDAILAFTKDLTVEDRVLVHCHMGMRRSTAAAIGILVQHGTDISEAFDRTYAIRPIMMPNLLVLGLFDDAFLLQGALIGYGRAWVKDRMAKDDEERRERLAGGKKNPPTNDAVAQMKRILGLLR